MASKLGTVSESLSPLSPLSLIPPLTSPSAAEPCGKRRSLRAVANYHPWLPAFTRDLNTPTLIHPLSEEIF